MDYQSAWDQHLDMAKQMHTHTSGCIKNKAAKYKWSIKEKQKHAHFKTLSSMSVDVIKKKDSLKTKSCQHLSVAKYPEVFNVGWMDQIHRSRKSLLTLSTDRVEGVIKTHIWRAVDFKFSRDSTRSILNGFWRVYPRYELRKRINSRVVLKN